MRACVCTENERGHNVVLFLDNPHSNEYYRYHGLYIAFFHASFAFHGLENDQNTNKNFIFRNAFKSSNH